MNRIWHHLFGRGIVPTVDNLGVQGEPPTHPELLDWLADDFVSKGWSQKQLIRQLVLSRTYQMSSRPAGPGRRACRIQPTCYCIERMCVAWKARRSGTLACQFRAG